MSFGRLQEGLSAILALPLSVIKCFTQAIFFKCNPKMLKITDLPIEVLAKIFTFVPVKDHASMSEVCKVFYDTSQIEYIWMHRCKKEYDISLSSEEFSCKELYTKLLYKFGNMIGLWQPEIASYGGLLEVKYEEGKLIGSELLPKLSTDIRLPLHQKKQFSIELVPGDDVIVRCIGKQQRRIHRAEISSISRNKFTFKCLDSGAHYMFHEREGLVSFILDGEYDLLNHDVRQELVLMKYLVLCNYKFCFGYNRVFLPKKCCNVPIQPGVFKGTYGAHGLELVMLDYEENGTVAKAVKISGDPNVPAGKVTFVSELNYGMVLTTDEQTSVGRLENLETVMRPYNPKEITEQPFRVPADCLERFKDVPHMCKARFHGSGQIAGHGFTNPSFTNGHWIIFDEDLFGFMWLELLSLSMFHRVKELEEQ